MWSGEGIHIETFGIKKKQELRGLPEPASKHEHKQGYTLYLVSHHVLRAVARALRTIGGLGVN